MCHLQLHYHPQVTYHPPKTRTQRYLTQGHNRQEIHKFWQSAALKPGSVLKEILLQKQYIKKLQTLSLFCSRRCFWASSTSCWNLDPDRNILFYCSTQFDALLRAAKKHHRIWQRNQARAKQSWSMKEKTEEDWINKLTILANTISVLLGNFAQCTRIIKSEQSSCLQRTLKETPVKSFLLSQYPHNQKYYDFHYWLVTCDNDASGKTAKLNKKQPRKVYFIFLMFCVLEQCFRWKRQ